MDSNATTEHNKSFKETTTKTELTLDEMDPLVHFSRILGIPEMIFNHLKAKDLMQISEVSPSWYNCIASSSYLMKKIKVVLSEYHAFQQENYDSLKNSSRKYQNIEVKRSFYSPEEATERVLAEKSKNNPKIMTNKKRNETCFTEFEWEDHGLKNRSRKYENTEVVERYYRKVKFLFRDFDLISKAHDWKNVSINQECFETKLDLWKFLSSVEESVESFSIRNRRQSDPIPVDSFSFRSRRQRDPESAKLKVLNFMKLKHLKMDFYHFPFMSEFHARLFLNLFAVETFEFESDYWPGADYGTLIKMLENFTKLTSLTLHLFEHLFEDDSWRRFQFKLKSLTLKFGENFGRNINFLNFLQTQSDQLEKMSIERCDNRKLIDIILKMPKLKSLDITRCEDSFENEIPKEKSSSITHLKLNYMLHANMINARNVKFLLLSMPNIKSLSIYLIDKEIFELLIEMERKFEELKVVRLRGVDKKDLEKIKVRKTV